MPLHSTRRRARVRRTPVSEGAATPAITAALLGTAEQIDAASVTLTNANYTNPTGGATKRLMAYWMGTKGAGTYAAAHTISGGGVTWGTVVAGNPANGPRGMFFCPATTTSPDGSDITVTCTGDVLDWTLKIVEWSNVHATDPYGREWGQGSGTNAASLLIPHMAIEDVDNVAVAYLFGGFGAEDVSWPEGTELWNEEAQEVGLGHAMAYITGGFGADAKVTPTWSSTVSNLSLVHEVRHTDSTPKECDAQPFHNTVAIDTGGDIGPTTALTPEDGDVVVIAFAWDYTTAGVPSAVQDSQGTPAQFTQIGSTVDIDATHRMQVWSNRYVTSPGSITILVDFPLTANMDQGVYWIFLIKNPQGSTDTDWVGNVDSDTVTGGTSLTGLSLGSTSSGSGVLVIAASDTFNEDFIAPDGFVCLDQTATASANIKGFGTSAADGEATLGVYWCAGTEDITPTFSVAGAARDLGALVIEVLGTAW